ncbi:hypothetical protein [Streptomyces acidiscabies]|uniref:hypothetical protein n=1 Tax=Streptomyces acidiscabies TaxID=42234 RepID=UPI000B2F053E|nr:hypothetical protein [Streptomyces acidiscabies]
MMPVTLDQVDVSDLTGSERAVALYASDMPNGRGQYEGVQVREWIVQGAGRLGVVELRRQAAFLYGFQRLRFSPLMNAALKARHAERFPAARRLKRADETASGSVWRDGITPEARGRNAAVLFDDGCPVCGGERQVWGRWVIDATSEWCESGFRACWLCADDKAGQ